MFTMLEATRFFLAPSWFGFYATIAASLFVGELAAQEKASPGGVAFFESKIRPVLVEHCYACHSADAAKNKKLKGGLLLDSREGLRQGGDNGPALIPGDAKKSLLLSLLRHDPKVGKMPPKAKLSDEIIADFAKWIDMGAPDPRDGKIAAADKYKVDFDEARQRWAFQLPKKITPPAVKNMNWPRSDLDRFVLAKQESLGLKPVGDAEPRVLLRRLYFDLLGLPPTPEQLKAFVKDPSPKALERVVEDLLKSPRFGERWARHWLDVVRYAEDRGGVGIDRGTFPFAWRYRQYVIDAFNEDKPYNQFVAEQIAGDLMTHKNEKDRVNAIIATGMQTLGPRVGSGEERLDERVDVMSRAFWGMSVGCARCHDHKFDPIYRHDYAAFVGIFMNSKVDERLPLGADQDFRKLSSEFDAKFKPLVKPLQDLGQRQTGIRNQLGKAGIMYVSGMTAEELLPRVPEKLRGQVKQQLKDLDKAREHAAKAMQEAHLEEPPLVMAIKEDAGKNYKTLLLEKKTEKGIQRTSVPRGMIRAMVHGESPVVDQKTQSGRLQAAQWAGSEQHPLTARVMVNRVWYHLFGRGIVESVDNFGATSDPPSHPELLDSLAVEFMKDGWSVKNLIRRIVLSRTYQLASVHDKTNASKDDVNAYYWRGQRRRLEAEAIRDAILASSGKLDLSRPSIIVQLATLGSGTFEALDDNHRSVYLPVLRDDLQPILKNFDGAEPLAVTGARGSTNVPTQALFMLNSNLVLAHSRRLADRLLADAKLADDKARLERVYLLVFGRAAEAAEVQQDLAFLKEWRQNYAFPAEESIKIQDSWAALCQTLLASAEFRYID